MKLNHLFLIFRYQFDSIETFNLKKSLSRAKDLLVLRQYIFCSRKYFVKQKKIFKTKIYDYF